MTREGPERPGRPRRRDLLRAVAGAGAASLAGCSVLGGSGDGNGNGDGADAPAATPAGEDRARELAERFAPRLYFDSAELWFPTDPRPYASDSDGETVVDGFDAMNGYTRRRKEESGLPDPTVFFRAVEYDDAPLVVAQFWLYAAFDQFTTNFHWHDWELLQVFVDTDSGAPVLYDASSHSRSVPNNEFLDPGERRPRLLSELGSHSSALSINDRPEQFDRYLDGGDIADVTNSALDAGGVLEGLPVAYGLPRDEGFRLPYVVPELDGAPLYDHERLPDVERSDLVPPELTVRSFDALDALPTDLPARETGVVLDHEGDADATYSLVPMAEVEDVTEFTGPQLSFEFAVPGFIEDAVASHITSVGTPWSQPRYTDPVADVTDPTHRAALAERYEAIEPGGPLATIAAGISEAVESADAPDGEGLTTQSTTVEAVALLESTPVAMPTFRGAAVLREVPAGDHRLTVNAAGAAPHSERVVAGESAEATVAGVEGEIPLVARRDAVRLGVDADGAEASLERLAVEDDFAGRLYDAPLDGPDAVYVHRGGAFTTEVEDTDGELGAFRVNPADEAEVTIDRPETGKASLASFLADISNETAAAVRGVSEESDDSEDGNTTTSGGGSSGPPDGDPGPVRGLARALEAVASAAGRAAEAAQAGDGAAADRRLEAVTNGLETVADRLAEAREDLPGGVGRATERRLEQARTRSEQAIAAGKL